MLAYGTNEAASSTRDQESYARRFAQIIETLHSYTPAASILVIGPPDRSTVVRRRWKTFTGTDKIIAAQKSVCARLNCAYWDQRERMGGTGTIFVNDAKVAEGRIDVTQPLLFSADETADVGIDLQTPVAPTIGSGEETRFTGQITRVTIALTQ